MVHRVDSSAVSRTTKGVSGTSFMRRRTSPPRTGVLNSTVSGPTGHAPLAPAQVSFTSRSSP